MITTILLSVATPPVPGGMAAAFVVLFSQLALPVEALAVILPISSIMDFPLTATDVFSSQSVLTIASKGFHPANETGKSRLK